MINKRLINTNRPKEIRCNETAPNFKEIGKKTSGNDVQSGQNSKCGYERYKCIKPEIRLTKILIPLNKAFLGNMGVTYSEFKKRIFKNIGKKDGDNHNPSIFSPSFG